MTPRPHLLLAVGLMPACVETHLLGNLGGEGGTEAGSTGTPGSTSSAGSSSGSTSAGATGAGTGSTGAVAGSTGGSGSGSSGGVDPGPAAECEVMDLGGTGGITMTVKRQSIWTEGACYDFTLTNETADDLQWTRSIRFGGTKDNHWNAEAVNLEEEDWQFSGNEVANNIVILDGQSIKFGACLLCTPP